MESLIGLIGLAVLVVVYIRRWLLRKDTPQQQMAPFQGELYRVGDACIARRGCTAPRATVVVMPGFVENYLYFTDYYDDPDLELIMLTSAHYHVPASQPRFQPAEWAVAPKSKPGTIAHDAAVLNLALTNLVSTRNVRVHGHSRGGAVVLEAACQQPELFEHAEVILEAPVLPKGKPYRQINGFILWLVPFYLAMWQQQPISEQNRRMWGPLDNKRKRELINNYPFNPKRAGIMITNMKDMDHWMKHTGTEVYRCVQRGAILVPSRDRILDPSSMLASARQAENLQVIEIEQGSHFVIFDHSESIPPLKQV